MAVKTIFIANLAEIARPIAKFMRRSRRQYEIAEDHGLCDRFVFCGGDDRVLVAPFPLDRKFFGDCLKILKYKNVVNLWPQKVGESLCESIIADKKLFLRLSQIISQNPGVNIASYAATPEFLKLISQLKRAGLKFNVPEVPLKNLWTTAFFDSKAGFRQTVDKLNHDFPTMPQGVICSEPSEILGFANYLWGQGKDIVIKANRGLAGAGLKIIRHASLKNKNIVDYLCQLLKKESYFRKDSVIVEEFINPDLSVCGGAPNVELKLTDEGVEVLYVCGMRVTPEGVFKGVELGKAAMPQALRSLMLKSSRIFGAYLRRFGYRGFFELDFVYGQDKKLYPIEANLRRTGGTHVWELASRVMGADFAKKYYVAANNMAKTKKFKGQSYGQVKSSVSRYLYPLGGKKEGVFLAITSLLDRGNLGYAVVGHTRARVYQIEKEFLSLL